LHSRLHSFCDEISATFARLLAYIGAVAVIAAMAAKIFGVPGVEASIDHAARPDWIVVDRPHRAFVLLLPEFPNQPEPIFAMHRHAGGGGRKDILSWGEPDSPGSRLMIEIYRPGNELKSFADLSTGAIVSTETLGAVVRVKPVEPIPSKFGEIALVDFNARRNERTRHCLGFARIFDDPRLQISGWYCKGGEEIINRHMIACALDRLTVIAAGSDPKMSQLFAKAELARQFCHPAGAPRGANVRRSDWIAAIRDPKLRGRFVTR
jgi:hypothetical protein